MVHAFVLVDAAAGTAENILAAVRDVVGVEEAHIIAGDFDLMVEINADEVRDVLATITREVRPIEGVGTTRSYISLEGGT